MVLELGVWGFEVEIPHRGPDSNIGLVKFPYVSLHPASEQSSQPSPYSPTPHTQTQPERPLKVKLHLFTENSTNEILRVTNWDNRTNPPLPGSCLNLSDDWLGEYKINAAPITVHPGPGGRMHSAPDGCMSDSHTHGTFYYFLLMELFCISDPRDRGPGKRQIKCSKKSRWA